MADFSNCIFRRIFAALIAWAFLAMIFGLPVVSLLMIAYCALADWWTKWLFLPVAHLLLIATAVYWIGPAFTSKRVSA